MTNDLCPLMLECFVSLVMKLSEKQKKNINFFLGLHRPKRRFMVDLNFEKKYQNPRKIDKYTNFWLLIDKLK